MKKQATLLLFLLAAALSGSAHDIDSTRSITLHHVSSAVFTHRLSGEHAGKSAGHIPEITLNVGYAFAPGWNISAEFQATQDEVFGMANDFNVVGSELLFSKTFRPAIGIKAGWYVQPFGHLGRRDEPLDFFTIDAPASEQTLFPFGMEAIGASLFGEHGQLAYEAMAAADLKAFTGRIEWGCPDVNLAVGLSGHWRNLADTLSCGTRARFALAALDAHFHHKHCLLRANTLFRHANPTSGASENALGCGIEMGCDLLSFSAHQFEKNRKLYAFARYDYADTAIRHTAGARTSNVACGINFMPLPCLVVKGEWHTQHEHRSGARTSEIGIAVAFVGDIF